MTQELEGRLNDMCNLGAVIECESIAKSAAKGRVEGIRERAVSDLRNLMETLGLSLEQAMADLKIPEAERQMYGKWLEQ